MNEAQKDFTNKSSQSVKVETLSTFSKALKYKQTTQLGIWLLFILTWYNYSVNTNPILIKQALPAIIIVSICLIIRSLNENQVKRNK